MPCRDDGGGDKSLKRKDRFWNDDLEPCIMKYCLRHQMQTLRYMKCIRRHCPSGLVTVPRDLEAEMQDTWQLPQQETKVNHVCAKLFCGYIVPTAARAACVLATCSKGKMSTNDMGTANSRQKLAVMDIWKTFAAKVYAQEMGGEATNDVGDDEAPDFADLKSRIKIGNLCGIVFCPNLNGISFLTCVEQRCNNRAEVDEVNSRANLKQILRDSEVNKRAGRQADDIQMPGAEMDASERTMVTKRKSNNGLIWCIDSYCGQHSSRSTRTACIIQKCNRMG